MSGYLYRLAQFTLEDKRAGRDVQEWLNEQGGRVIYLAQPLGGCWLAVVEIESESEKAPTKESAPSLPKGAKQKGG